MDLTLPIILYGPLIASAAIAICRKPGDESSPAFNVLCCLCIVPVMIMLIGFSRDGFTPGAGGTQTFVDLIWLLTVFTFGGVLAIAVAVHILAGRFIGLTIRLIVENA